MSTKKYKVKVGDLYLHHTFAGVNVVSKITVVNESPGIHMGVLTRRCDLLALKKSGVSYSGKEKLCNCEGVVYEFQIIKKWRKKLK
jgi:hypothetical protein